jgi:hypothetical protein
MQVQARAEEAMKRSADVAHLDWLEPESDEGNVEYKLRLKDPSTMRFQQLVTQMKFRLSEGNGECFYYLGKRLRCLAAQCFVMMLFRTAAHICNHFLRCTLRHGREGSMLSAFKQPMQ